MLHGCHAVGKRQGASYCKQIVNTSTGTSCYDNRIDTDRTTDTLRAVMTPVIRLARRLCATASSMLLALLALTATPAHARPVDLSTPSNAFGPASDQGYASRWTEVSEADFGGGFTLPVRLGFFSGRVVASRTLGSAPWRIPLLSARVFDTQPDSCKILLPCGRVMTLVPGTVGWSTADGEWSSSPLGGGRLLVFRADGWEMEFDGRGYLARLRTDRGRQAFWIRDAAGELTSVVERPAGGAPDVVGLSVARDTATGLCSSLSVRTAFGTKTYPLSYDAQRRLSGVGFPDQSALAMAYSATAAGDPSMTVVERSGTPSVLVWSRTDQSLLSDGTWSYQVTRPAAGGCSVVRTGPYGETETYLDDQATNRTTLGYADGSSVVTVKVSAGPAKGKTASVRRVVGGQETILYHAEYDPLGMLASETDAAGLTTSHSYVLFVAGDVQSGVRTHATTRLTAPSWLPGGAMASAALVTATEEFDIRGNLVSTTDALGVTTLREYDQQDRLVRETGPGGRLLGTYAYDPRGPVSAVTDASGAATAFAYDQDGNLVSATDALGGVVRHEYDARGRRVRTVDALGRVTLQEHDGFGRVVRRTVAAGTTAQLVTTFSYDAQGRVLSAADSDGRSVAFVRDSHGRVVRRTDAQGRQTTYSYDVAMGCAAQASCSESDLPTRVVSPAGRVTVRRHGPGRILLEETVAAGTPLAAVTRHAYDAAGRRIATTDPLGRITRLRYGQSGGPYEVINPDGTSRHAAYDFEGRAVIEDDELGAVTRRAYDAYGNLISATGPDGAVWTYERAGADAPMGRISAVVSPSGERTAFSYDLLGRRVLTTKAAGTPLAAAYAEAYDASGAVISSSGPEGQSVSYEYDARGRPARTVDALGRSWSYAYSASAGATTVTVTNPDGSAEIRRSDADGRPLAVTDAAGASTAYAYDPDGLLSGLTDARGNVTLWARDARGQVSSKTYADSSAESYERDAAGRLVRRIRPDGAVATYAYDLRSRLSSVRWSAGRAEPSDFEYDAAGRLTMARNTSATVRRAYAASGRLASETQEIHPALGVSVPPLVATVGYATSADGRLSRITYPDGAAVDYEHDARGDVSRVVASGAPGSGPSQALELSYLRRADGRLAGMARSNGVASAFTYDAAGRLLSVAHRDRASAVLGSESLRYDAAGRRSSRVREDGATDFFRYDPAGQVTAAAYGLAASADPVAFPASQTFAYDPAGNRTQAVDGPLTASYQANAVNQYSRILVGAAETIPSYDALGNLLEDDRAAYAWDADIHLLSVAPKDGGPAAAYRYDALHRRVARLEGSATLTYFVHDGWNVVAEYAGSPGSSALAHEVRHVWGEDLGGGLQTAGGVGGLLASVRASGANWAHYDGNGNVVLLTDGAGAASARYAYDAFGRLKSSSGPAAEANRYRFSTKPQERAAALSYYGYRYYAPSYGRWLSRDPIEEDGGINLQQFVYNSPLNYVDPNGLTGWELNNPNTPYMNPGYSSPTMQGVEVAGTIASIFIEPLDWAMTGKEIYDDPANPWSYAGLIPAIPCSLGKYGKKLTSRLKNGPAMKTAKEARDFAKSNGWEKVASLESKGQEVYTDGKRYFTRDVDGHAGGAWKELNSKGKRIGTLDENLKRIGD
jgi:RHS repeat-associated protein